MDSLFLTKLAISFFVGGFSIALLGYLGERANKKIAGIIISLPSTVVISYFFIGWTLSAQDVANIVPSTIVGNVAIQVFTVVYVYVSKIKLKRIVSILLSVSAGLISWFVIATPVAMVKFSSLSLSLLVYAFSVPFAYYFLTVKNTAGDVQKILTYSLTQKIGRAVFSGLIIALAVFLANVLHPFWGGVFSSFPALFTSTFVILHWYYGSSMIEKITKAIPLGSVIYVLYTVVVRYSFPAFGIILGTLFAYFMSLLFFMVIYKTKKSVS